MKHAWSRLWLVLAWFWKREQPLHPCEQPTVERSRTTPEFKAGRLRASDVEEAGRWYFRRNILDQLDDYFMFLSRLKWHHPHAYSIYSRVGVVCLSPETGLYFAGLQKAETQSLVGLGGVALIDEDDDEFITPRLAYFQKLASPGPEVARLPGTTVFEVTLFYARKRKSLAGEPWADFWTRCGQRIPRRMREFPAGFPWSFYVGVTVDGSIRALKKRSVQYERLPEAKKALTEVGRRKGRYSIGALHLQRYKWAYPAILTERERRDGTIETTDPHVKATELFSMIYNGYVNASMDVRVRVEKDGMIAAFAVDLLRTPYFFADRDKSSVTINGKRRPIFHIVRTHERRVGDASTFVRSHFRGERRFTWSGYGVNITMPGKHHTDLLDFDIGAHVFDEEEPLPKGFSDMKWLGKKLDEHLNV